MDGVVGGMAEALIQIIKSLKYESLVFANTHSNDRTCICTLYDDFQIS